MTNIRPITNALAGKARDELFEVSERVADDIEKIRSWIEKQPYLRARVDDQFIITFLRGCKFSLERTKEKIDMYYTVRTAFPEIFVKRDRNLETNIEIIRMGAVIGLPMGDGDDRPRIILFRLGLYDPNKYRIEDFLRVALMVQDILVEEDDNIVIAGQISIFDMCNASMAHFVQYTPTFVKKLAMVVQEGSPLRVKGFHYINTKAGFDLVFNLFKSFLKEKIRKRLYVHGDNMASLFEHVPKNLLPLEYGGGVGPIQNIINEWEKKIISHSGFFKNQEQYGCDERKRVGARKPQESLFGIDGSFRNLNVD